MVVPARDWVDAQRGAGPEGGREQHKRRRYQSRRHTRSTWVAKALQPRIEVTEVDLYKTISTYPHFFLG